MRAPPESRYAFMLNSDSRVWHSYDPAKPRADRGRDTLSDMALYPLVPPHIRRSRRKPEKVAALHCVGVKVCAHINGQMEHDPDESWRTFSYGGVAHQLKVEEKDVAEILSELGGGGNGIIVVKRDVGAWRARQAP